MFTSFQRKLSRGVSASTADLREVCDDKFFSGGLLRRKTTSLHHELFDSMENLTRNLARTRKQRPIALERDDSGFGFRFVATEKKNVFIVDEIRPSGPADKMDIKVGDLITKINGNKSVDEDQLKQIMVSRQPLRFLLLPRGHHRNPSNPSPASPDKQAQLDEESQHILRAMFLTAQESRVRAEENFRLDPENPSIKRQYDEAIKNVEQLERRLSISSPDATAISPSAIENTYKQPTIKKPVSRRNSLTEPARAWIFDHFSPKTLPKPHKKRRSQHSMTSSEELSKKFVSLPRLDYEMDKVSPPHSPISVRSGGSIDGSFTGFDLGEEDQELYGGSFDESNSPFNNFAQLKSHPAHITVLLTYLFNYGKDASPLVFHLLTDRFHSMVISQAKTSSPKHWAFEIASLFLYENSPLRIKFESSQNFEDINIVNRINSADSDNLLAEVFYPYNKCSEELVNSLLADHKEAMAKSETWGDEEHIHKQLGSNPKPEEEVFLAVRKMTSFLNEAWNQNLISSDEKRDALELCMHSLLKLWDPKYSLSMPLLLSKARIGSKLEPLQTNYKQSSKANGHKLVAFSYCDLPNSQCHVCSRVIWGASLAIQRCSECNQVVHKSCVQNISSCSHRKMSSSPFNLQGIFRRGSSVYTKTSEKKKTESASIDEENSNLVANSIDSGCASNPSQDSLVGSEESVKAVPYRSASSVVRSGSLKTNDVVKKPNNQRRATSNPDTVAVGVAIGGMNQPSSSSSTSGVGSHASIEEIVDKMNTEQGESYEVYSANEVLFGNSLESSIEVMINDSSASLNQKELTRLYTIREFILNEKMLIKNMCVLRYVFYDVLRSNNFIPSQLPEDSFEHLIDLIEFHLDLLQELEKMTRLEDLFRDFGPIIQSAFCGEKGDDYYQMASKFIASTSERYEAIQQNPLLHEVIQRQESDSRCQKRNFAFFSRVYFTHFFQYTIILQKILKNCEEDSSEHECIVAVRNQIAFNQEKINDEVRAKETLIAHTRVVNKCERNFTNRPKSSYLKLFKDFDYASTEELLLDTPANLKLSYEGKAHFLGRVHCFLFKEHLAVFQKDENREKYYWKPFLKFKCPSLLSKDSMTKVDILNSEKKETPHFYCIYDFKSEKNEKNSFFVNYTFEINISDRAKLFIKHLKPTEQSKFVGHGQTIVSKQEPSGEEDSAFTDDSRLTETMSADSSSVQQTLRENRQRILSIMKENARLTAQHCSLDTERESPSYLGQSNQAMGTSEEQTTLQINALISLLRSISRDDSPYPVMGLNALHSPSEISSILEPQSNQTVTTTEGISQINLEGYDVTGDNERTEVMVSRFANEEFMQLIDLFEKALSKFHIAKWQYDRNYAAEARISPSEDLITSTPAPVSPDQGVLMTPSSEDVSFSNIPVKEEESTSNQAIS